MRMLIVAVIVVVGLLCVAAGVVYFVEPAHSLPSFFPSHAAAGAIGANVKHTKKGLVAVIVGGVVVVIGIVVALVRPGSASDAG